MKILKKLKLRTKLQKQLNNIDDYLYKSHYYENDLKLNTSKFCSDEYIEHYYSVESLFRILLNKKRKLQTLIELLSGRNLFKKLRLKDFII